MNELIEKLLKPVSGNQPCGLDLSNDPRFDELQTILKGKPEVDIGSIQKPAEPPNWRELMDKSAKFLGDSKHLGVAVMLCCSLLKTGGLAGFRDGLQLIRGLLEQYWPALYPPLDVEDNSDPTERLNTFHSLRSPRGSVTGWLTILDYLYAAPICQLKGAPPITFDDLQAARRTGEGAEGAPAAAPGAAKLAAALREAGSDQLAANHKTLQEALETVQAIDQFLTTTLGAGNTDSFEVLEQTLREMVSGLAAFLPGTDAGAGAKNEAVGGDAAVSAAGAGAISVSGPVRSREDVVRAIDRICEYYRQVEPCSPVPYLLRRAQKLAAMDFVQALQELNLATVDSLRPSMGSAVDAGAASG